jgi:type VI secretion system protein ImpB
MSGNKRDKDNSGRVHITYDVYTGDARVKRELPFVVGVIGDFAGSRKMDPLAERRFIDIVDRKGIDAAMEGIKPEISVQVEEDGLSQTISFTSMADFEPAKLAQNIPEIRELTELRVRLRELLTKASRSEDLTELLEKIADPRIRDFVASQIDTKRTDATDAPKS